MNYTVRVKLKTWVWVNAGLPEKVEEAGAEDPAYWAANVMDSALVALGQPWWGRMFNANHSENAWMQLYESAKRTGGRR